MVGAVLFEREGDEGGDADAGLAGGVDQLLVKFLGKEEIPGVRRGG